MDNKNNHSVLQDMESDPAVNKLGEFIVNQLGINLVAVESIYVDRQEDGQITDIHIAFIPQPAEGVQNAGKRSIKERYKKIADSKEFKDAYEGKSIGEVMEIEDL